MRHSEQSLRRSGALLLSMIAAAGLGMAQFGSLVTISDGSRLYFTSALQQEGASQPAHGKIFLVDSVGARPVAIRYRDWMPSPLPGPDSGSSNFYNLVGVDVPGDVSTMAVIALRECHLTAGLCSYLDQTTVYNNRGEEVLTIEGHLSLSPNGRWGLATLVGLTNPYTLQTVVDMTTGTRYPVSIPLLGYRDWRQHDIADVGTAVIAGGDKIVLFRPPDRVQIIAVPSPGLPGTGAQAAVIDAAARTVVWTQTGADSSSLRAARLEAVPVVTSLETPGRDDFAPAISDDGRRILFLSKPLGIDDPQIFVMDADGSGQRQVTLEPEGIRSAVLSGDGRVAWALTRRGRVLQMRIDTNERREMIGPVTAFLEDPVIAAQGQAADVAASVARNQAIQVEIDGGSVPVLGVEDGRVTFQVPWNLEELQPHTATIRSGGSSGWTGSTLDVRVFAVLPSFLRAEGEAYALAAHERFESAITPESPARPGEIIHLYAKRLGPVSPEVPTGAPAPGSPPARITRLMVCFAQSGQVPEVPADILYAGLAPGTIGYYQVDVRLPPVVPADSLTLSCDIPGWSEGYSRFTALLPFRPQVPASAFH